MSLRLKLFYGAIVGAWGGLLGWAILDLLLRFESDQPYLDATVVGLVVGICIGALVGGFLGLMEGTVRRALSGIGYGLVTGLVGGVIGLLVGQALFQALGGQDYGRVAGWAIFGLGIGMGEGLAHRSARGILYGSLGGLLGGALGGLAFTAIRNALERPTTGRAWGFALLGALIGFFAGLIPLLFRKAWLKVVSSGRDEGKEYIVEKGVTTLGRSDKCDMILTGDPGVQQVHVEIRQEGGGFVLNPRAPVTVNGQEVGRHILQDEDRIGLGSVKIRFRTGR